MVLLLAALLALPLPAREGADPAINRPYADPDFEQWVERFESEGREVFEKRREIVVATGVKPGMNVADIGAGTGLFTLLFAHAVQGGTSAAAGTVYAVDISKSFVDNIERRAKEAKLGNITGIVGTQSNTGLAPQSVALAFVCDTYHHFEQPRAMLRSIHRALVSGGTLVVIDYERIPGASSGWILGHVRAGREEVVREVEGEGFRLVEQPPLLKENFFLKFVKRD
jgi:ubiquinone/menaquinone biosynthesis C-methylase UbiE